MGKVTPAGCFIGQSHRHSLTLMGRAVIKSMDTFFKKKVSFFFLWVIRDIITYTKTSEVKKNKKK